MAKKRVAVVNGGQPNGEDIRSVLVAQGTLRMVQKQADRIYKLFELPHDYPERDSAIIKYQEALKRNGIESPPETVHEAIELINQVGEFHG